MIRHLEVVVDIAVLLVGDMIQEAAGTAVLLVGEDIAALQEV